MIPIELRSIYGGAERYRFCPKCNVAMCYSKLIGWYCNTCTDTDHISDGP